MLQQLSFAAGVPVQPNFLVLLPDQWRHDWLPAQVPSLTMPVLAGLISRGTYFSQAYVPSPLCAPSRSSLASGREYDFAGVPDNFSNDYNISLPTFYTSLRTAGYHTMSVGKDDLTKATGPGLNGSFHADALGWADYERSMGKEDCVAEATPSDPYGTFCAARSVEVGGKNESLWQVLRGDTAHCCANATAGPSGYVCPTGTYMPQEDYCDDYVADRAISVLARKPSGVPWFLQVNFPGPHPPFVVTSAMFNGTRTRTWPAPTDNALLPAADAHKMRADYASELENLDGLFGRILAALEASGEANSTMIIVVSDHGEMLGDHDDYGKTMPWQGSASVPLLVSAPFLGVPAGATVASPVATIDVAGTVLDYAGVTPAPGMTLSSLRPFMQASTSELAVPLAPTLPAAPYRPFVASGLLSWRLVVQTRGDTDYKLICCRGACPGAPRNATAAFDSDAVAAAAASGPAAPAETTRLYATRADPFDMHDLASEQPAVVAAMVPLLPSGWCGAV